MKFRQVLETSIFILLATLFSFYIFAHIVAVIFLVEIPHIKAVSSTIAPNVILPDKSVKPPESERTKYGFFGRPNVLRIPRLSFSMNLNEAIKKNDGYLTTEQIGFFHVFNHSKAGHLGDTVFFTSDTAKTLNIVSLLVENDRIVVETNLNWRYHYRVKSKTVVSPTQPFLPASSNASKIYISRPVKDGQFLLIEAVFQNLEEIAI